MPDSIFIEWLDDPPRNRNYRKYVEREACSQALDFIASQSNQPACVLEALYDFQIESIDPAHMTGEARLWHDANVLAQTVVHSFRLNCQIAILTSRPNTVH
jgi:hypothetical protein